MMPIDNNEDTTMWFEVLQRLTKIEANTDGLNEISGIARSALVKSEENAQDIEDMKEAQKWTWRTIAGIGISVTVYLITRFLGGN